MSQISVSNLTFAYDGSYDNVFEDVSFQIDTDWRLGFIGRNGRGKTTFLNLLMGAYEYNGTIHAPVEFDYFPFNVADPSLDTLDVMYGITADAQLWRIQRELSLLGVEEEALYRPFGTLSNGERTKVLLAGLFLKDGRFLLIDEPTNHLDMAARETVSEYLKRKKGFILVSHDRRFLDNCADHILSINKNDIEVQKGNFSCWWENKQARDAFEQASNDRLQKDIKELSAAAKRTAAWSDKVEKSKHAPLASGLSADKGHIGHQAAKLMKRSKAIETRRQSAIEQKSQLLKNVETADALKLHPLPYHAGRLTELADISISFGKKQVCNGISLTIRQGERIALTGRNGSGKTSLLKLVAGQGIPYTGRLEVGSGLIISYVPQDTSFLRGGLKGYAAQNGIDESLFKAILRKLDFSREQFDKDMAGFSGGQKKKVLLAGSLCESAHLYIWDEPLNYIDLLSRVQIEELILEYRPSMLFVEHDGEFAGKIATQILAL